MTQDEFSKVKVGIIVEILDSQFEVVSIDETNRGRILHLAHENGGETTADIRDAESMIIVDMREG